MTQSGGKSSYFEYRCIYCIGQLSAYLDTGDLMVYVRELVEKRKPITSLEKAVANVDFFYTKHWVSAFELGLYRILNYVLVRELKPAYFIETGVLHGITSSFILSAISENMSGQLISIDYPSYYETGPVNKDGFNDTLPPGKEPGWVIPEQDRKYWKLFLGNSLDVLPSVFRSIDAIDIFLHDSEHTYETMSGEFNLAWEKIRKGGILICDNIDTNASFYDFCRKVDREPALFPEACPESGGNIRFGLIRK